MIIPRPPWTCSHKVCVSKLLPVGCLQGTHHGIMKASYVWISLLSEFWSGPLLLFRGNTHSHLSQKSGRTYGAPKATSRFRNIISATVNVVAPPAVAAKYTHHITGTNPWNTKEHQPHHPAATHTAADDRQERAPDLVLKFFAQWEPPLHWAEVSYNLKLNISTQHWGRSFKDMISCPWNNLHWVVGRAKLLVAVDSGVCSLKNWEPPDRGTVEVRAKPLVGTL